MRAYTYKAARDDIRRSAPEPLVLRTVLLDDVYRFEPWHMREHLAHFEVRPAPGVHDYEPGGRDASRTIQPSGRVEYPVSWTVRKGSLTAWAAAALLEDGRPYVYAHFGVPLVAVDWPWIAPRLSWRFRLLHPIRTRRLLTPRPHTDPAVFSVFWPSPLLGITFEEPR